MECNVSQERRIQRRNGEILAHPVWLYNQELQWATRWTTPPQKKELGKKNKTNSQTPQSTVHIVALAATLPFHECELQMFRYQLVRTVNGGKPRKHMPWLTAKVKLVLTLIPLGFLSVLSLPNLSSPLFRFFATLLSPSKLSFKS